MNYVEDEYSQGYSHFEEAFRALTKDDILQPYISDDVFRSSNGGLLSFDIIYTLQLPNQKK